LRRRTHSAKPTPSMPPPGGRPARRLKICDGTSPQPNILEKSPPQFKPYSHYTTPILIPNPIPNHILSLCVYWSSGKGRRLKALLSRESRFDAPLPRFRVVQIAASVIPLNPA